MNMPTKFLKPKNMRRGLLALLLAAPLVYMFGSLFFALNGAHEGIDLKQSITSTSITSNIGLKSGYLIDRATGQDVIGEGHQRVSEYVYIDGASTLNASSATSVYIYDINQGYLGFFNTNLSSLKLGDNYSYIRLYKSGSVSEISYTLYYPNYESNSNYLFNQFFAKDNWVASLGEKAVNNETGIGLPFVGDLISYIDEYAMPLSNSAYGYFIWGFSSYILNVLAIYMVVSIAASLVLIPMKVVDSLEERING